MNWNSVAWLLTGAMVPYVKAVIRSRGEPTPDVQLISGIYGYLVICGVIFNCAVAIVFVSEVLL